MSTWNSGLFNGTLPNGGGSALSAIVASDIIYRALRIAGVLQNAERTAAAEVNRDALKALNSLIDTWRIERLLVHAMPRVVYTLTSGQAEYEIGPGAEWNAGQIPVRLERAGIESSDSEIPIEVIDYQRWARISNKGTSGRPNSIYVQNLRPFALLTFWPVPSEALDVALYWWQTLTEVASADEQMYLPHGYRRALEYNLAVELNTIFPGRPMSPEAVRMAIESKAAVKSFNRPNLEMRCDEGILNRTGSTFDIESGSYLL